MPSFNKVFLMGNLTRRPELRRTKNGTPVCSFGLAVNRRYRSRDNRDQEETTFIDITVWNRQAETCSDNLNTGSSVFIEGRLKQNRWEDRETGSKRSRIEVVASRVQFLNLSSGSSGNDDNSQGSYGGYNQDNSSQNYDNNPQSNYNKSNSGGEAPQMPKESFDVDVSENEDDDVSDNIPF